MNEQYREAMGKALFLANRARETGDVPVGAVVVDENGRIIGRGWNCREAHHDPAGHAEIVALREAGRARGTWRLTGCTLVVTLEPCTMIALSSARGTRRQVPLAPCATSCATPACPTRPR